MSKCPNCRAFYYGKKSDHFCKSFSWIIPQRVKDRKTAVEKLSPRMREYLTLVIDTPIEGFGLDAEIARRMNITPGCVYIYKKGIAERLTREELLEVCENIMKEAA